MSLILIVENSDSNVGITVWARGEFRNLDVLGNGQLRLLAFAAMPELRADLVILEELESGIPSEKLPHILDDLRQCPFQILLSSYGPTEPPAANVTHLSECTQAPC